MTDKTVYVYDVKSRKLIPVLYHDNGNGTYSQAMYMGPQDINIGNVDVLSVPVDPFGVNDDAAIVTDISGSISGKLRGLVKLLIDKITVKIDPVGPDYSQTITVAQNQSLSEAIDIGPGYCLVGFIPPSAVEANTAAISIQAAPSSGGTYTTVYQDNTRYSLPFSVSTFVSISNNLSPLMLSLRFFKITLETAAGVAVPQTTASRTFTIIKRLL